MRVKCPITCDSCLTLPPVSTPTSLPPVSGPSCEDSSEKFALEDDPSFEKPCSFWVKRDKCSVSSIMRVKCPITCDSCLTLPPVSAPTSLPPVSGPSCEDSSEKFALEDNASLIKPCSFWAKRDRCSGSSIMRVKCPIACDSCLTFPPVSSPTSKCIDTKGKFRGQNNKK